MRPTKGEAASWRTVTVDELVGPLNEEERRNAPATLYVAGDAELLRAAPTVAVVGARRASPNALKRAARLSRELVAGGVTVVSGLAEGIDTEAHRSAIAAGGKTVAVLGTPLDQYYPRRNAELQRLIMREYLAVSQFPPGYPTNRTNFPRRNRTMAILTDATVIVEASDSSGTLHQGWEALRLNRPLFILRSVAESPSLAWPEEMLRHGAQVLSDTGELFERIPGGPSSELADLAL